jgi:hypothetical protein
MADEKESHQAWIEALSGNKEKAASLLRTALEKGQTTPEELREDIDWEDFWEEPWFTALVGEWEDVPADSHHD